MGIHVSRINPYVSDYTSSDKAEVKSSAAVEKTEKSYATDPVATYSPSPAINPKDTVAYAITPMVLPIPFIDKYVNPEVVEKALKTNPNIKDLLLSRNVIPVISAKNIGAHTKRHMFTTYMYAMELAKQVGLDAENTNVLAQAALVHDIGKALIPESIIQKPAKLTPEERKVIDLHADLSAEIIKTTDIDPRVVAIVGKHHITTDEAGDDLVSQILSVADVYSALKEERPYKTAMPDSQAFKIMEKMPKLSQPLVQSLKFARCQIASSYKT